MILCQPPEIAGPGFINLTLKPSYLETQLKDLIIDNRLGVAAVTPVKKLLSIFPVPILPKKCTSVTCDRL